MTNGADSERAEVDPKIRIEGLKKHFLSNDDLLSRLNPFEDDQFVKAVDGVDFEIAPGEAFGVAGESGCGKSTLGKTLLQLTDPTAGSIYFDGVDITGNVEAVGGEGSFRTEAQIIHQDPYKSINPRFTVFKWIKEPLDIHNWGSREEKEAHVMETLERVGLKPAEAYASEYPSELSGGERQRVGIARAIVLEPSFLVADEPASMLDVSIRASVLDLLDGLRESMGLSILYISHDLSLLKHMCDRLAIMYLGHIVEIGDANDVIDDPKHPYTQAMVSSTPIIDPHVDRKPIKLEGEVPDPIDVPTGCRFHPRCPKLIQPDGYAFDQDEWLAVATLRRDILADDLALTDEQEQSIEMANDQATAMREAFEEAYDLPRRVDDAGAEEVLTTALEDLANGDAGSARDRLETAFTTRCEQPPMEMLELGPGREARCALYEDEPTMEATPSPSESADAD